MCTLIADIGKRTEYKAKANLIRNRRTTMKRGHKLAQHNMEVFKAQFNSNAAIWKVELNRSKKDIWIGTNQGNINFYYHFQNIYGNKMV